MNEIFKRNVLLLCDFHANSANTIIDHAVSFKKYSKNNIYYFNPVHRVKPAWLNLDEFDIIIIHYSIFSISNSYIDYGWRKALSESSAVKVQFIQDEYRKVKYFHKFISECNINILFTCYPEPGIDKVYPTAIFPDLIKINTYTGYVPEYFETSAPDFGQNRTIDVGYRARGIGYWWMGELYQEKFRIGNRFLEFANKSGLVCDISNREEDRIYGNNWINFLKKSKCTLGTESGASVIDFTGELEQIITDYCKKHPEATFETVQNLFLKDYEHKIRMNQISPRIFEAIGCGTVLILFEGKYSGILKPDIHYIPLKKDFSNIQDVILKIKDKDYLKNMAETAYMDIVQSGRYSYNQFIKNFDHHLNAYFTSRKNNHIQPKRQVSKAIHEDTSKDIIKQLAFKLMKNTICKKLIVFVYDIFPNKEKHSFLINEEKLLAEHLRDK